MVRSSWLDVVRNWLASDIKNRRGWRHPAVRRRSQPAAELLRLEPRALLAGVALPTQTLADPGSLDTSSLRSPSNDVDNAHSDEDGPTQVLSNGGLSADQTGNLIVVAASGAENLTMTSVMLVDASDHPIAAPVTGEMVFIQANWVTDNLSASNNYVVRFSVDGVDLDSNVLTGQSGTGLSYYWWRGGWYASPGQHTISVTVDGSQSIAETNELDNTRQLTFSPVIPSSLPAKLSSPIGFDPNVDWAIGNYIDVDPRVGIAADYLGGRYQYDQHNGWDIGIANFAAMDEGVPIIAAADGVVSATEDGNYDRNPIPGANGQPWNSVTIDHGQGWTTIYGHMAANTLTVSPGSVVKRGEILGFTGSSGNSSGPHIHFMVLHNGALVETAYDTADYWQTTRPYTPDIPMTIQDAGITNYNPFSPTFDAGERAADKGTFSRTTESSTAMWFWYNVANIPAGTNYEIRWVRPNGTTAYTNSQTQSTAGGGVYGWVPPGGVWTQAIGTWQVQLWANDQQLVSRSVQVIDGTPPAEIRVRDSNGLIVVDDRTTPFDLATPVTFTLENYGGSTLNISQIRLPAGFGFVGNVPTSINSGASATVTIQLTAAIPGMYLGDVVVVSNDSTNTEYAFRVSGTVSGQPAAGTPAVNLPRPAIIDLPDGLAAIIDDTAVVTDGDAPANVVNYQLNVDLVSGFFLGDTLSVASGLALSISGTNVLHNGNIVASITTTPTAIAATFTSLANLADVQLLLRSIALKAGVGPNSGGQRIVRAIVTDEAGHASPAQYATVIVPYNSHAPIISSQSFSIAENSPNNTVVGSIAASDLDVGQSLTYTIVGGNIGNVFAINSTTGQITVANSAGLNYEAKSAVPLTVQVTDNSPAALARQAEIVVNIIDVNEPPSVVLQNTTTFLPDNQTLATRLAVADIVIADDVLGSNSLSLSGPDASTFEIFANALYLKAGTVLDVDVKPNYLVAVNVDDPNVGGTPDGSASFTLTLTRSNRSPMVTGKSVTLAENSPNATVVTTVQASDSDGNTLVFAIIGGNTNGAFGINANTGAITVANVAVLDFENQPPFDLSVRVTDNGIPSLSATGTIHVTLTDVNDPPRVTNNGSKVLPENSPNGTSVFNFSTLASDQDVNQTLTYAITAGNTNGAFAVNLNTGVITVANVAALNYEATPTFQLTMQVTDTANATTTATFFVNLQDANEAPVITNLTDFRVNENSPNGGVIYQYAAADPDVGQTKTFSIESGNTGNAFAMNAQTGALTVNNSAALDYETNPIFNLTLKIQDNGTPALYSSYLVKGYLNDLNEAPVIGGALANQPVNDNATINPFAAMTVTDPNNQNMLVKVTINNGVVRGDFTATSAAGWTRTPSGNNLIYSRFYSPAPNIGSIVQAAVRSLVFQPRSNVIPPGTTETTGFTVFVNDGIDTASDSTTSVVATSVNTAPTIGGAVANQTMTDGDTKAVFNTLTVTDPDNQSLLAKVTILNGVVRGDFTAATTTGWTRTVTGNNIIYSRFYNAQANVGSVAQTAIRAMIFQPRSNAIKPNTTETTAFTVFLNDGISNVTDITTTVVVSSVNNAPVISGASHTVTVNDNATVNPLAALTVSDVDLQEMLISVTILNGKVRGDFTTASTAGWAVRYTTGNDITYKRYFSPQVNVGAAAQAAFRALVFQPRTNAIKPGTTELTDFQVTVSDGVAPAVLGTGTRVTTTSVNEAPTISGTVANQMMNDNQTKAVFSTVTVTDPDTQDQFVRITITNGTTHGDFTAASTAGWTRKVSGANILYERFFAAAANNGAVVQTAVRALAFQPRTNVPVGTTETTSFTIFVNDGLANVTNSTTSVITTGVAPRQAAPVVMVPPLFQQDDITTVVLPMVRKVPSNPLTRLLKKSR